MLGLPKRELAIAAAADHSQICKFGDIEGDDYEPIQGNIVKMADGAMKLFNKRRSTRGGISSM